MKYQKRLGWLVAWISAAWLLSYESAVGETADTSHENNQHATDLQEIVVTANRREDRIQDVAMGVAAIGGVELGKTQTLDLQDLAGKVPGLNIEEGGFDGIGTRLILRGLNTGNSGATVATVVDNVPFSLSGSISNGGSFATDIDTYDMDHIEVLRGPQGSLYGATAEGGLVKYVTKAPNLTEYEAGFETGGMYVESAAGPGRFGKGYANIPLVNGELAFRSSLFYEDNPGWINDQVIGKNQANSFQRYGGRASLLWQPTEDFSIRTTAFIQHQSVQNLNLIEVNGFFNQANPLGRVNGNNFDAYLLQPNETSTQVYSLSMEYGMSWAHLESITSGGRIRQTYSIDDPIYVDLNNALDFFGRPNTTLSQVGSAGMTKYSQEIRLSSNPGMSVLGRAMEWQGGAFFTRESGYGLNHYVTQDYPSRTSVSTPLSPTTPEVFYTNTPSVYQEEAGYADATYHFSKQVDLELGGRVFHNQQHADETEGGVLFGPPITTITDLGEIASHETKGTYAAAARYHFTPDDMAYVRIASGYRPGGPEMIIAGGPPGLPIQYGSDSTVNYEVGFKGAAFENRLTLNVDVFDIEWKKVQVTATVLTNAGTTTEASFPETENVGKAKSRGGEWELSWRPLEGLTLATVGAYTDAKLTADAPGINAFSGDQLPYVSKVNANLSVEYDWQLTGQTSAFAGAGWSYIGSRYNDFNRLPGDSHQPIPSYDAYDAQLGVRIKQYQVELFGKNLSDARGITYYNPGFVPLPGFRIPGDAIYIRPRTIGLRISGEF